MTLLPRLLRWLLLRAHALHLQSQGHHRAAELMRQWKPADYSPLTIARGKANLIRRFGGR